MDIGIVKPVMVEEEMKSSYLDYAMSVIVSRALPDAEGWLEALQRRIAGVDARSQPGPIAAIGSAPDMRWRAGNYHPPWRGGDLPDTGPDGPGVHMRYPWPTARNQLYRRRPPAAYAIHRGRV